jgi:hypothetical protein
MYRRNVGNISNVDEVRTLRSGVNIHPEPLLNPKITNKVLLNFSCSTDYKNIRVNLPYLRHATRKSRLQTSLGRSVALLVYNLFEPHAGTVA